MGASTPRASYVPAPALLVSRASSTTSRAPGAPRSAALNVNISTSTVLANGTVVPGNVVLPNEGSPAALAYDSTTTDLWTCGNSPSVLEEIGGSPQRVVDSIALSSGSVDLAMLPSSQEVVVTGGYTGNLSVVSATTGSLLQVVHVGSNIAGIVYDAANGELYIADQGAGQVLEVSATTLAVTSTFTVGSTPEALALDPSNAQLYIADQGSASISILNTTTGALQGTVAVGSGPDAVAFDAPANRVAVANGQSNNLTILNPSTDLSVGQVAVGTTPDGIAADPTTGDLYVANAISRDVSVVDPLTLAALGALPVGKTPGGVLADPSNGMVYVANEGSGNLTEISLASRTIAGELVTGSNAINDVYDTTDRTLFVTDQLGNRVWELNATTLRVIGSVGVGTYPQGLAWDRGTDRIFVADQFGTPWDSQGGVTVLNGATGTVIATLPAGNQPEAAIDDPVTGEVYVTNTVSNNVTVFNAATLQTVATIAVGAFPFGGTYDPVTGQIWVLDAGAASVTVVDGTTHAVIAFSVPVQSAPNGAVFDPIDQNIYVGNSGSDLVSVINGSSFVPITNIVAGNSVSSVAVDPQNGYVEATAQGAGLVAVIDPKTLSTVAQYPDPGSPDWLTFDPVTGYFLMADQAAGRVGASGLLVATSFSAAPNPVSAGQSVTLSVGVPDGPGAVSYAYTGLPAGCASLDLPVLTCTPSSTSSGTYNVVVDFWDNFGKSGSTSLVLTVNGPLTVHASASPAHVTQFGWTSITLTATGGTPPLRSMGLLGLPSSAFACPSFPTGGNVSISCQALQVGNYSATLYAADSGGANQSTTLSLQVARPIGVPRPSAVPDYFELGGSTLISVAPYGGTPPYSFVYPRLPPGCATQNSPTLTCHPLSAGSYTIEVSVSDQGGGETNATLGLFVYPALELAGVTPTPTTWTVGSQGTLTVTAAGGPGPITYDYLQLPPGCASVNASTLTCAPSSSGSYPVEVQVSDPVGNVRIAWTNVTVLAGSSGVGATELLLVGGAAIVVAVLLSVLLLVRRRRRRRAEGAPSMEPQGPPAPTYQGASYPPSAPPTPPYPAGGGGGYPPPPGPPPPPGGWR